METPVERVFRDFEPTQEPAPVVIPDLFFPQEGDKVRTVLEHDVTIQVENDNAKLGSDPEYIGLEAGTTIFRLLDRCRFARWTGLEWIFMVERGPDKFFVRASDKPGIWEEVGEEPTTAVAG